MKKLVMLKYFIPLTISAGIAILYANLIKLGFGSSVLLLFVIIPLIINVSTRYTISNSKWKIAIALCTSVAFYGLLYYGTYATDFGVLVKYSFFWSVIVLALYDWAIKGELNYGN